MTTQQWYGSHPEPASKAASWSFRLPRSGIYFSFGASFGLSFTTENVDFKGYEPDVWCDPAHALDAALNLILHYGLADLDTWQAFRSAVYAVT